MRELRQDEIKIVSSCYRAFMKAIPGKEGAPGHSPGATRGKAKRPACDARGGPSILQCG
jgi:hypothetical protein